MVTLYAKGILDNAGRAANRCPMLRMSFDRHVRHFDGNLRSEQNRIAAKANDRIGCGGRYRLSQFQVRLRRHLSSLLQYLASPVLSYTTDILSRGTGREEMHQTAGDRTAYQQEATEENDNARHVVHIYRCALFSARYPSRPLSG